MACKCDPSRKNGDECECKNSPPFPAGSPPRALNPTICPRGTQCGNGFRSISLNNRNDGASPKTFTTKGDERFARQKINIPLNCEEGKDMNTVFDMDTSCVSLQFGRRAPCAKPLSLKAKKPRCPARGPEPLQEPPPCRNVESASGKIRKKLGGRRSPHQSGKCATGIDVRVPCGTAVENYEQCLTAKMLENREMSGLENTCYDEDGYSSEYGSANLSYRHDPRRHADGKRCASDKRRNMLKAKLRELLSETKPIPESCLLENTESKPEPEILAEVLLMSEAEGIDLAELKPDSVFDNLFADMSFDRSITITNAAPESTMSDVVVPIQVSGQEATSFEMPNIESVMEKTRDTIPPNPNAFQQSTVYETFSTHMSELLERTPATGNVSEFLGSSIIEDEANGTQRTQDSILEYIIKPGPPAHTNKVRLNGSTKPIWFPGYILVSPAIPGCIRMTDDPGEALREAWRLCRPRHFNEKSRYLVDIR